MQKLNFPSRNYRLQTSAGTTRIFDEVRKKWLVLTPEEWVRQHLVFYLHEQKSFPLVLMALEKSLRLNGMARRSDLLVYDKNRKALLLAECKAPGIRITQKAFDQAARYNMTLRVPYLIITNGMEHYCCRIDFGTGAYEFLENIPDFGEIA